MYSTCLFCNQDLGRNEVIESFPVGRRLAFDGAKGRLWVVCRKCERWNLSPLEERWEAIEDAERLFGETRMRVSTDNIGLARLREGLELVRIGSALRPEMAAWRYGDQFGRRRRRHLIYSVGGIALVTGVVIAGPVTGLLAGGGWGMFQGINALHDVYQRRRVRVKLRLPDSQSVVPIRKAQLEHTSLAPADDGWALHVSMRKPGADDPKSATPRVLVFTGVEALGAAGKLLPAINAEGAKQRQVQEAVRLISEAPDPTTVFRKYAGAPPPRLNRRLRTEPGTPLHMLPLEARLALEMAAHEEQERRALEGELALLEAAWRDAEEVAGISDDMFLPSGTTARLEDMKRRG